MASLPLTAVQVAQHAKDGGFTGWTVATAVAVFKAESGHNAYAVNVVGNETRIVNGVEQPNPAYRSLDVGLAQFNTHWHPQHKIADLLDPKYSMTAAKGLWQSKFNAVTGTWAQRVHEAWMQWVSYQLGAHEPFYKEAADAARAVGAI